MKLFIERPVATAMFFLAVLVLGVVSFFNTPLELAPSEDFPEVNVNTIWPGVPPEVIQTQLTAPLEEVLGTIKGVRKVKSTSQIGASCITLEFDPKTNMEFTSLALREQIAKILATLPYGVKPMVEPYVPDDFRVRPFLSYSISGNVPLQKLRQLVKTKIELGIGAVRSVASVAFTGGSDPEIKIILDNAKIKNYAINPNQIVLALQERLRIYPAGKMTQGNREYIFKIADTLTRPDEIKNTVIAKSGQNLICLGDVAQVDLGSGDVLSSHRINGQPTIFVSITKEKGANTLKVSHDVKDKLEAIKKELPPDLVFKIVDDESAEIIKNLKDLGLLAVIITAAVFLIIFMILRSFKPSLLILSSIAFSVVITFCLIYFLKIAMNMLTLGALALGFGMFVDDSIVVFENILRLREKGLSPIEATLQGPREVFVAVLASTLTTISVFFCFPYFQGRLKIFYMPLAIVITAALAASLLVSFTLIPALSPRLLKQGKKKEVQSENRWYEKTMSVLLRHPLEVLLLIVVMLYGSFHWFKAEVSVGEWFRWYSKNYLYVSIGLPPGTAIERTDELIKKFEEKALQGGYEKEINVDLSSERATMVIGFPPAVENSAAPFLLKGELIQLATQFADININVSGFDPEGYYYSRSGGSYLGSSIKFTGYNLKELKDITASLEKTLLKNRRIKQVRIIASNRDIWWNSDNAVENILKINRSALQQYNLNPQYLYYYLSVILKGNFSTPLRLNIDGTETAIAVKFPQADLLDLTRFQETLIKSNSGEYLRLGDITQLEERQIPGAIDRENQQFEQTVMWEYVGSAKAEERYRKAVYAGLQLPPGFAASLETHGWMTEQEKSQIVWAIVFSLVIIYMILAALYESFIYPFFILMAVPLGMIGVFVAFVLAKYPFDSSAYIGVIILSGIVVKNAILLVDHINLKRSQGLDLCQAVIQGARERIRPVFMTTSATVCGILPLLLIQGQEGVKRQIWSTLALCTVGGLVSSTLFILVVIPLLYYHGEGIHAWIQRRIAEMRAVGKSDQ